MREQGRLSLREEGADEYLVDLPLLPLQTLAQDHPGVTVAVARYLEEAACVCLTRHHKGPVPWSVRVGSGEVQQYVTQFIRADSQMRNAHLNRDDATRDGAYGLALASAYVGMPVKVISRAQGLTGADFYAIPRDAEFDPTDLDLDRDDLLRLEVSGIDSDTEAKLQARLRRKVNQTAAGASSIPAVSAIVGFKSATTLLSEIHGDGG